MTFSPSTAPHGASERAIAAGLASGADRPPPGAPHRPDAVYGWACCVFGGFNFVYLYGLRTECQGLIAKHQGTTLLKEMNISLATAQGRAEAAAAQLGEIYEGLGSAQAMPVRHFLREYCGLDLDRAERLARRA